MGVYCEHRHIYKYLWRRCQDDKIILKAWKKLRKGKTRRKEVIEIEENFDYYFNLMKETVYNTRPDGDRNKWFKPVYHKPKKIIEHGKLRIIFCPSIWEQWFHHIIIAVLEPIFIKTSYPYSCGSMPKRGGIYGKRKLEKAIRNHPFRYFAKLDIRHFFTNVRLDDVIKTLKTLIDDEWFIFMIRRIFFYHTKGLPLGFYPSQWFANFILSPIDWMIKRQHHNVFIRYMDDYVICGNNKRKLHRTIVKIKRALGKIHLRLKSNYQVIAFEWFNPKQGIIKCRKIDFMGFLFGRFKTTLRKSIFYKATRLIRRLEKLQVISCHQAQSMLSRLGWFKHTDTEFIWKIITRDSINIDSLKHIVSRHDTKHR